MGSYKSTPISRMQLYIVLGAVAFLIAVRTGLSRVIAAS